MICPSRKYPTITENQYAHRYFGFFLVKNQTTKSVKAKFFYYLSYKCPLYISSFKNCQVPWMGRKEFGFFSCVGVKLLCIYGQTQQGIQKNQTNIVKINTFFNFVKKYLQDIFLKICCLMVFFPFCD